MRTKHNTQQRHRDKIISIIGVDEYQKRKVE